MPTPTSYVGMPPMRYEVVIERDGFVHERIQTNSMDTANRTLFSALPPNHEWKVTMFIEGTPAAWRFDKRCI